MVVMLRDGPLYDLSLPTKLVEGLAAGRPIIASAGGDTARLVVTGRVGGAARPEDPAKLREAILAIAGSGDRAAMGRRARLLAEQQFDRATIVASLSRYLQEVAGSA
jgi:glycosyltransferase involved in cell wall biosynthesis